MTRTVAIIAAALCGMTSIAASQAGVGLKGGLSHGTVSNRGVLPGELEGRSGFAVGVSVGGGVKLLGVGIEALYAQRGVVSETDVLSRRLDYVDVPLYLRALIPTPGVAPYAYAGPQVSFELACRAGSLECPDTDRPKTTYAAVIGAGVRLGAQSAFTVEARYIYGLTDLRLGTVTNPDSYRTRSFLVLGGVAF